MLEPPSSTRPSRTRRWLRAVAWRVAILGSCFAVVVAVAQGCAVLESKAFYFPERSAFATPPGVEDVVFPGPEGSELHAWWIPARNTDPATAPTVLHTHGNAGHLAYHIAFVEWLTDAGFNVLLFDYRGYGRSTDAGRLVRSMLLADAHAALDYLLTRPDVDPARVGLFGFSMGGVVGLNLAAERPELRAIVAAAPFSTWRGVASDYAGPLGPLLIPAGLDAKDAATRLGDRPLLIVHGSHDGVVSVRHAEIVAEAASRAGVPTRAMYQPGADHERLLTDHPEVQRAIEAFLSEHLDASNTP